MDTTTLKIPSVMEIDSVYKSLINTLGPDSMALITAAKAYLKQLHASTAAHAHYVQSLRTFTSSISSNSSLKKDFEEALKHLEEQQRNQLTMLKQLYIDFILEIETEVEKQAKILQSTHRSYLNKIRKTMKKQKSNDTLAESALENLVSLENKIYQFVLDKQKIMIPEHLIKMEEPLEPEVPPVMRKNSGPSQPAPEEPVPVPLLPQIKEKEEPHHKVFRAVYDFCAVDDDNDGLNQFLGFKVGDIIVFKGHGNNKKGWMLGEVNGKSGWFPAAYVEEIIEPEVDYEDSDDETVVSHGCQASQASTVSRSTASLNTSSVGTIAVAETKGNKNPGTVRNFLKRTMSFVTMRKKSVDDEFVFHRDWTTMARNNNYIYTKERSRTRGKWEDLWDYQCGDNGWSSGQERMTRGRS